MPLDPRVQRFLRLLAASNPSDVLTASVAERRAGLAALMRLGGPPASVVRIEDRSVPGAAGPLAARVYTPLDCSAPRTPGLAYFHGGGHIAGDIDTHDSVARELANAGRCRIVSIDYRLAPEHPFPAALDDARSAVEYIAAHAAEFGIDAARFGICGDSAGGTIAAATSHALAGTAVLALQVLICPILDYGRATPSWREFATGYLIDDATLAHDLIHYMPRGVDATDQRISPLRADRLSGLPRTLVHTAEFDPLRDEGRQYFERLSREGCEVSYTCHPGMIHLFYALRAVIPSAGYALAVIGDQIQDAFASPRSSIEPAMADRKEIEE